MNVKLCQTEIEPTFQPLNKGGIEEKSHNRPATSTLQTTNSQGRQKPLNCNACNREAGERDFCPFHQKAYKNIVKNYDYWRKGLKIPWKEYLSKIEKNSLTGEWTREVAKHLTKKEETQNVTKS